MAREEQALIVIVLGFIIKFIGYACFVAALPSVLATLLCIGVTHISSYGGWRQFFVAPVKWLCLSFYWPFMIFQVSVILLHSHADLSFLRHPLLE